LLKILGSSSIAETERSSTLVRQQTASEGVATSVVQSKSQEATISAQNADKFASTLRESAGIQVIKISLRMFVYHPYVRNGGIAKQSKWCGQTKQ